MTIETRTRQIVRGYHEATLVYDVHTATPVGTQRTAEHFRLDDAGITSIMLIFDGTPWQAMLARMGKPRRRRSGEALRLYAASRAR